VIVDRGGLILVESKCTIGGWSYLRRMVRKAVRQLTRSVRADPRVTAAVVLASSLKAHRVGVWSQGRGALLAGPSANSANADRMHRQLGIGDQQRHQQERAWWCW
jgi:hypothetical protein